QVGIPEMGNNEFVYGLPFVRFTSNVRGGPDTASDVPYATLDSAVNTTGTVLAPGYLFDEAANGFAGLSVNLAPRPGPRPAAGRRERHDGAWEQLKSQISAAFPDLAAQGVLDRGPAGLDQIPPGLTDLYNQLAAVPSDCEIPFVPFRFDLVAAATAMTRDELIAHATAQAQQLRQA